MSTPTQDQPTTPLPRRPAPRQSPQPNPPWIPGVRVVAAGIAFLVVLVGTVAVVGSFFVRTHTEARNFTGTVSAVQVSVDVGDVRVTPDAAAGTARVTASITDSFSDARWSAELNGSTLVVDGSCERSGLSIFGCDVDLDIILPPGTTLKISSDTGDLSVSGGFAGVDATTSTGDVKLDEVAGPVSAGTNTGDIRGLALGGGTADVRTQTGDVRLEFATVPRTVSARTNTGDVRIEVPAGTTPYAVDVRTDTGDETVDVPNVPTAPNTITAKTDTGDVRVAYP